MNQQRNFKRAYWLTGLAVFVLVVLRCILVPFSHDEVATFFFYIQPEKFIPFYSHPDANGHFLTSFTSWICFKLFGSQVWSLRIPCMLAFLLLLYAVYRFQSLFKNLAVKIIFSSAFILSYNFIAFYALCRGYGVSMSFLLLSLYCFFRNIESGGSRSFLKFLLFSQLALSANLTLVAVISMLTAILIFFQFRRREFFRIINLLALVLYFGILYCWVRYAFYLQETGALYYGEGDSYWKTTFVSLIDTIYLRSRIIDWVLIVIAGIMSLALILRFVQRSFKEVIFDRFVIAFLCFCGLVIGFYLLHRLLGVNFPEDRTGLFFYLFFVIAFCFFIEELTVPLRMLALAAPAGYILHFILNMNLQVHPWRVYETMPYSFFDKLVEEQKKADHPITIAGHRVREFFYGFINYNSPAKLNHITSPENLQMNCDYALAYANDQPWYQKYYTVLDSEDYWSFRLLKRKNPIERKVLFSSDAYESQQGEFEYKNLVELQDTTFHSAQPLQADLTFSMDEAPVPFNAWLVMQIDPLWPDETPVFIRVPFNLIKYDWNGSKQFTTSIVSGQIPKKIKRLVVYIWNIDKKPVKMKIDNFKLYQLGGEGVELISKANL